jgi:pimeloyl-ACP methyl ester carboxylesterase
MRVDSDGVGIHVAIDGPAAATPILALSGILGSIETYDFLPDLLATRRLLRMDMRGHGRSDRCPGRYRIDDYARDVVAVLDEIGDGPAVIVAHSFGGMLAVRVAQWRPDLVRAVFLEDAGLYASDPDWMEISGFGAGFPVVEQAIRGWQGSGVSAEEIAEQLAEGSDDTSDSLHADAIAFRSVDPAVFEPILDGSIVTGFDADLPIPVPGVLLTTDPTIGGAFLERDVVRLQASNPQIEIITVAGAGHLMHGSRALRRVYVDHLHQFVDRWTAGADTRSADA